MNCVKKERRHVYRLFLYSSKNEKMLKCKNYTYWSYSLSTSSQLSDKFSSSVCFTTGSTEIRAFSIHWVISIDSSFSLISKYSIDSSLFSRPFFSSWGIIKSAS